MTVATETDLERFMRGEPGIYDRIPFPTYLRAPFMSQSVLKAGRDSMKHLKHALDGRRNMKVTDDMTMGSALHTCFLEPMQALERFALWTGARRYGADFDAFCDANEGKAILTRDMYAKVIGMTEALRADQRVAAWVGGMTRVEVSCIGEIDGVPFRGRADALTQDPLWDLKKVTATDDRTIVRTIEDYGYAIQAWCYCKLFNRSRFCLGMVEGTPPHDVRVIEFSETWLKLGGIEARRLLRRYQECLASGHWPGVSEKIDIMEPPDWVAQQFGSGKTITVGGESAFE